MTWKEAMEEKGPSECRKEEDHDLWYGPGPLQISGEFPSAICCIGVGSNSIFCNSCKHWVHKKSCWLKRLAKDTDIRCTWCQVTACPLDGRPQRIVQVESDKLVAMFCSLGDMLSAADGCELSTTTRENRLEEIEAATSSLFPLPVFQDMWLRVQLLCAECNAQC